MTLKAFLFLMVVTIVAVTGSALIAEMLLAPGFERGIVIAVLSSLVVFPAARWAEYRGWIEGSWSPGGERRRERDARRAAEAGDAGPSQSTQPGDAGPLQSMQADKTQPDKTNQDNANPADASAGRTQETQQPPAGRASSLVKAGDTEPPGDRR